MCSLVRKELRHCMLFGPDYYTLPLGQSRCLYNKEGYVHPTIMKTYRWHFKFPRMMHIPFRNEMFCFFLKVETFLATGMKLMSQR